MAYPHLAARVFNTPLLIHRAKLDAILAVLAPRFDLRGQAPPAIPPPRGVASSADSIAVLPIHGTLVKRTSGLEALSGLTSVEMIGQAFDTALADPSVTAIVLDVDSGGGEVAGIFDLADRIRAARGTKPIVAVSNEAAYSAAYALASAADTVYLARTAGVGSIGVIALHVDQSAQDAAEGLTYTAITAGAHKNDGSPHAPLTDAARASVQAEVDRLYTLFVTTVAEARGLSVEAVRATEAGLYFGADAVTAGLADRVGTLADALADLSTPPASQPALVHPPENTTMSNPTESTAAPPVLDAIAIAQTCALAGRPDLTVSFLERGLALEAVRNELLSLRAQGPEITSHLVPGATSASAKLEDNPLVRAAQARVTKGGAR